MRETPIIFLSADEDKKRVVQALTAGANDYITKPVHEQELIVRIETHIELYLQKQRMLEQRRLLERRNEELQRINQVSRLLTELMRPEQLVRLVSYLVHLTFGYPTVSILLRDGDDLVVRAVAGISDEEARMGRSKLIPAKLDASEPPFGFGDVQAADLSSWGGDYNHHQWARFVGAITAKVRPVGAQSAAPQAPLQQQPQPQASAPKTFDPLAIGDFLKSLRN